MEKKEDNNVSFRESLNRKEIKNTLQNIILVLCGTALLSCGISLIVNKGDVSRMNLFGYRLSYVLSDSMEPTIMTHALCVTDMIHKDYKVGDVVVYKHTYKDGPTVLIVHRIKKINDDITIVTKGDNNDKEDPWVTPTSDVLGKIVIVWNSFAKI